MVCIHRCVINVLRPLLSADQSVHTFFTSVFVDFGTNLRLTLSCLVRNEYARLPSFFYGIVTTHKLGRW